MAFKFEAGQKLTLVCAQSFMRYTTLKRVELLEVGEDGGIYRSMAGKSKKRYRLHFDRDTLIFHGHTVPFDTEPAHGIWFGDGQLRLVAADRNKLKLFLQEKQINPLFTAWGKITYRHPEELKRNSTKLFEEAA